MKANKDIETLSQKEGFGRLFNFRHFRHFL